MGQTIAGGYYKGVNGKFHDANGQPVEAQSEKGLAKAVSEAAPEEAEASTDPGPMGPLVPVSSLAPEAPASKKVKKAKKAKKAKEPKKAKKAEHSSLIF